MNFSRSSGILLHPTSLPGRFGIGDLGSEAYRFADFLAGCGQKLWQVMPLGPTGYGDSPYMCFSAFAGNPLLISPEKLLEDGLLSPSDLDLTPPFPPNKVDYGLVIEFKITLLKKSSQNFKSGAPGAQKDKFAAFCQRNSSWLDDYALFMSLKDAHGGAVWNTWEKDIATRGTKEIRGSTKTLDSQVFFHKYLQYQFFKQWSKLKRYVNDKGIKIIGDIPIFVAYDSAEVWSHPELFHLDAEGRSTVVAGVPPDYFSSSGQLWGNPLYRWDYMSRTGYEWWVERLRSVMALVDMVRLDHFRGFEAYWEVPSSARTAEEGKWVKGPGAHFFRALEKGLGQLPIIAEDLGMITPKVENLRDQFGFPGMRIIQFAFNSDSKNPYLPHNYPANCAVYIGTHDNDTAIGWFNTLPPHERENVMKYAATDGWDIGWTLIRLAMASVADTAIITLQDVLAIGHEGRMNTPGTAGGNWSWRYPPEALGDEIAGRLGESTAIYGRL